MDENPTLSEHRDYFKNKAKKYLEAGGTPVGLVDACEEAAWRLKEAKKPLINDAELTLEPVYGGKYKCRLELTYWEGIEVDRGINHCNISIEFNAKDDKELIKMFGRHCRKFQKMVDYNGKIHVTVKSLYRIDTKKILERIVEASEPKQIKEVSEVGR